MCVLSGLVTHAAFIVEGGVVQVRSFFSLCLQGASQDSNHASPAVEIEVYIVQYAFEKQVGMVDTTVDLAGYTH